MGIENNKNNYKEDIAIVGIGCRYPDANDYTKYWENVLAGKNSIKEVDNERWNIDKYYLNEDINDNFLIGKWCGVLDDIYMFDNEFFNISPREAISLDPQQRLILQETYHCIEDSGINLKKLKDRVTSVFVGASTNDYSYSVYDTSISIDSYALSSNYLSALSNRISYFWGFSGKSYTLDAACASSLIAVDEAKNELLSGKCDYAIAAGVNLALDEARYIGLSKARMISPSGKCNVFSSDADGYVPGDGVGVILLQRLSEAVRDNNHIYGVIKGGAVNHVGKSQSITAPSIEAQKECILKAWKESEINPEKINYIEAHGTGTFVGDPIEIEALKRAFEEYTDKKGFCRIGSVKSNIGHLEPASGMASIIKVLMMIKNQEFPKTLNIKDINPIIDFENSPFKVCIDNKEWKESKEPRLVGVSSMGFTGANAHIVIEEYKENRKKYRKARNELEGMREFPFIISSRNKVSLQKQIELWKDYLENNKESNINDICLTLSNREQYEYRIGKTVNSVSDIRNYINNIDISNIDKNKYSESWLLIENSEVNGYKDIEKDIEEFEVVEKQIKNLLKYIEVNKRKDFYEEVWGKDNAEVFRFIITYSHLLLLKEIGVSFNVISSEGNGIWSMIAFSEMVDSKKIIKHLLNKESIKEVKRPNVPIFDHVSNRLIKPFEVSKEKVSDIQKFINNNEKIDENKLSYFINKSRTLYKNQFSYKRILDDFNNTYIKFSKEKNLDYLCLENFNDNEKLSIKEKKFFIIIMLFAIKKINMKWGLNETVEFKENYINLLTDYLLLDLLDKEDFINLFWNNNYDVAEMAVKISSNSNKVSIEKLKKINHEDNELLWKEETTKLLDSMRNSKESNLTNFNSSINTLFKLNVGKRNLLNDLLDIWKSGSNIMWGAIYKDNQYTKVNLPTYCFNESYFNIKTPKEKLSSYLLQKEWVNCQGNKFEDVKITGKILLIINKETREIANKFIEESKADCMILSESNKYEKVSYIEYNMNYKSIYDADKLIKELDDNEIDIGTIIDISDIRENAFENVELSIGKIRVYQHLLKKSLGNEMFIEHFTNGLVSYKTDKQTLAGADMASFVKLLSIENKLVKAKTIDVDIDIKDQDEYVNVINTEIQSWNNVGEICYRDRNRFYPKLVKTNNKNINFNSKLNETNDFESLNLVAISGGTRGLGAEVARYFASNGVKKLILMGRKYIPSRENWELILESNKDLELIKTIKLVYELEAKGVTIELYSGSLTDYEKVNNFFESAQEKLGTIDGVVHCAGVLVNGNSSFLNKKCEDINKTFEPKLEGLQVLDKVFKDKMLKFFVLFSSVSAVIPSLSVGMIDYGASNGFMDYFANYVSKNRKYKYLSINWPGWDGVGMKWSMSKNYLDTGLTAQSRNEGIAMLDYLIKNNTNGSVVPCIVREDDFNCEKLLDAKQIKDKSSELLPVPKVVTQINDFDTNHNLKMIFSEVLKLDMSKIDDNDNFSDLGVDSIMLADLVRKIEKIIDGNIDATVLLEYSTIKLLATYIDNNLGGINNSNVEIKEHSNSNLTIEIDDLKAAGEEDNKIAIIGMGCNFPGAKDIDEYWNNLSSGKDSIIEIPKERFDISPYYSSTYEKGKSISKWGGFIDGVEYFDPEYFELKKEDAVNFDPLVRQYLEVSNEAIRDAGYSRNEFGDKNVGVFVGSRVSQYSSYVKEYTKNTVTGLGQNFIAAHISHYFNLKGPSLVLDSACSSSILSVHMACKSILSGECSMAIAGGVDILLNEQVYLMLSEGRALSPDGKCHTFDLKANGFVPGEGCGAILIKRLSKAIEDGDKIYGVIDGSAVNNDGHTMGITTPSPEAQKEVISRALNDANVNAETVSYIEAHGTGTMIGDPIELKALTSVFRNYTLEKQFCAIGSVKTNIGHLLSAAGIASIIKVALSAYNKMIPPTLNCDTPNVRFKFDESPFYINNRLNKWEGINGLRRAGISSFGFGGTNGHIIISGFEEDKAINYKVKRNRLEKAKYNKEKYWLKESISIKKNDISDLLRLVKE